MRYLIENLRSDGKNPNAVLTGFGTAWVAFFLILSLPLPNGLSPNGMMVLAIVVWASVMWVSEALPVGITGISIPT